MLYNTASFWRETTGQIWHSLCSYTPGAGTRDLMIGPVSGFNAGTSYHQKQYEKMLAWVKSHGMKITDTVTPQEI